MQAVCEPYDWHTTQLKIKRFPLAGCHASDAVHVSRVSVDVDSSYARLSVFLLLLFFMTVACKEAVLNVDNSNGLCLTTSKIGTVLLVVD